MGKVMTSNGFTIRELKGGRFSVTLTEWAGEKCHEHYVFNSFNEAGSEVYEMAPNNEIGREVNHKMCRVFGRLFY